MTRRKLVFATAIAVALAVVAAFFTLRTTPLDQALAAIEQRDYFFDEDLDADPGLSPTRATSMVASGNQPPVGPVAGFMTHDSPGRGNDLKDQPVYLFVVDEFHDPGPVMLDGPPPPARHVVFIYEQGGAVSTIAIPHEH